MSSMLLSGLHGVFTHCAWFPFGILANSQGDKQYQWFPRWRNHSVSQITRCCKGLNPSSYWWTWRVCSNRTFFLLQLIIQPLAFGWVHDHPGQQYSQLLMWLYVTLSLSFLWKCFRQDTYRLLGRFWRRCETFLHLCFLLLVRIWTWWYEQG